MTSDQPAPTSPNTAPETSDAPQTSPNTAPETSDAPEHRLGEEPTVIFVRHGRSLNIGGFVVLSLIVGALVGLVWGLIAKVDSINTLMLGALNGVLFIGGALCVVVLIVDSILQRRRR